MNIASLCKMYDELKFTVTELTSLALLLEQEQLKLNDCSKNSVP